MSKNQCECPLWGCTSDRLQLAGYSLSEPYRATSIFVPQVNTNASDLIYIDANVNVLVDS